MLRAGTEPVNRRPVRLCAITFMPTEPIVRIQAVEVAHHCIAVNLGNDRRRAYRGHPPVAADHRRPIDLPAAEHQSGQAVTVHLDPGRHQAQAEYCAPHCEAGGLEDVETIDFMAVGPGNRPRNGAHPDLSSEFLPGCLGQQLRVGKTIDRAIRIENDGACHDGPRQRSAARFVDPGDRAVDG